MAKVNVINRNSVRAAQQRHPQCRKWLDDWWSITRKATWTSLADVRRDYSTTDQVGGCLVFDAPGGRRFIVGVYYARPDAPDTGTLYIKHFLTHAEYDRNTWKKDC
jgi:mRNA interferase HigB